MLRQQLDQMTAVRDPALAASLAAWKALGASPVEPTQHGIGGGSEWIIQQVRTRLYVPEEGHRSHIGTPLVMKISV